MEAYRHELADPASLTLVYPIGTRTRFFAASGTGAPAPHPWPMQSAERVAGVIVRSIEADQMDIYPDRC